MRMDGYAAIPRWVLARTPEIGCTALAVYAVLASHANDSGDCRPSHETIARVAGVTDRTVRTALRVLESAGMITRKRRKHDTAIYSIQERKCASVQESRTEAGFRKNGSVLPPRTEAGFRENDTKERHLRTKEKRSPSNGQYDPLAVDLPFQSAEFRSAWKDFAEMRSEKKPLTERAAKIVLRKLAGWGEPAAIESLEASTVSEWQGVFPPKSNGQPKCKVLTVEEYANWNPYTGGTA